LGAHDGRQAMSITLKGSGGCPRQWAQLAGDGPARFCGDCRKTVYDLDAMSDAEIEALMCANPAGFCATFVGGRDAVFRREQRTGTPLQAGALAAAVAAAFIGCADPPTVTAPPSVPPEAGTSEGVVDPYTGASVEVGAQTRTTIDVRT